MVTSMCQSLALLAGPGASNSCESMSTRVSRSMVEWIKMRLISYPHYSSMSQATTTTRQHIQKFVTHLAPLRGHCFTWRFPQACLVPSLKAWGNRAAQITPVLSLRSLLGVTLLQLSSLIRFCTLYFPSHPSSALTITLG